MDRDSFSEIDKGKQPLGETSFSEIDKGKQLLEETSAEESTSRDLPRFDQRQMNEGKLPDHQLDDADSSLAFMGLQKPKAKRDLEVRNPSHGSEHGEKCGNPSMASMASGKRSICQLPNLDLSLLPPRVPLGSFPYHHKGQPAASPQQYCPVPASPNLDLFRSPTPGAEQPLGSLLTIFYGGKVNVYNVSADKAKDIMAVANRISALSGSGNPGTPSSSGPPTPLNFAACCSEMKSPVTPYPSPSAEAMANRCQSPQTINAAALPISRKFSIQRFLEKRNDRLYGKAPYALPHPPQNQ